MWKKDCKEEKNLFFEIIHLKKVNKKESLIHELKHEKMFLSIPETLFCLSYFYDILVFV